MVETPEKALSRFARSYRPHPLPKMTLDWLESQHRDNTVLHNVEVLAAAAYEQSEALDDVREAMMSDEVLRSLPPRSDNQPTLVFAGGRARFSLKEAPSHLLAASLSRRLLCGEDWNAPVLEQFLHEGVAALRDAVSGKAVGHRVLVGFAGPWIEDGERFESPWGVMTSTQSIPRVPSANMLGGSDLTTALLTLEPSFAVKFFEDDSFERQRFDEFDELVGRATRLLPMAILLGCDRGRLPWAPQYLWTKTILPFSIGNGYQFRPTSMLGVPAYPLAEALDSITSWSEVLDEHHVDGIDVALDRLLAATVPSVSARAALVDAVTAWENLLGSRSDTGFKVTAALACLLEPEPTDRRALHDELSRIYDIRSRVVHGEEPEARKLSLASRRAVEVGVLALGESYQRGADWLALKNTERVKRLLLGPPSG